jgi:hypothetical protein
MKKFTLHNFEPGPFPNHYDIFVSEDECPLVAPSDGSEACTYQDIRSVVGGTSSNFDQLTGTWFLAAYSRRSLAATDGQLYHISVLNTSIEVTVAWPIRSENALFFR